MNAEQFDKAAREVTDYFKYNDAHHPARESADDVIKHAEQLQRDNAAMLEVLNEARYLFAHGLNARSSDAATANHNAKAARKTHAQIEAIIARRCIAETTT